MQANILPAQPTALGSGCRSTRASSCLGRRSYRPTSSGKLPPAARGRPPGHAITGHERSDAAHRQSALRRIGLRCRHDDPHRQVTPVCLLCLHCEAHLRRGALPDTRDPAGLSRRNRPLRPCRPHPTAGAADGASARGPGEVRCCGCTAPQGSRWRPKREGRGGNEDSPLARDGRGGPDVL